MNTQFFRFILHSIIVSLTCLNLAATSPASSENGTHFCGVTEQQLDNRRYARTLANLDDGVARMVKLIYFLPSDQPYRADVVRRMKNQILNIQAFYAEQMEAHGYGKVTFRIETNAEGKPMVHRVDGQYPENHYSEDLTTVFEECERAFNLNSYISLIVEDNSTGSLGGGQAGLGERWGKNSGYAVVTGEVNFGVTAHELGHAFGLEHDFRNGAYIMSYGPGWNELSSCSAQFLSVHPYFNPDIPIERGQSPTVELISPRIYPAGAGSVPIRFQVNDSEGLHQVILRGFGGLIACRELAGETDATVEFNYGGAVTFQGLTLLPDAPVHRFFVEAVDTDGNWSAHMPFSLVESSPHRIAILEGHTRWLHSVSFSPDGSTLASGGDDQTVKLWDVVKQQDIATLPHGARVTSVAFSRDGMLLASGAVDGTVTIWDVTTQQIVRTLLHGDQVTSVAFSRDGAPLASGSRDGTVKLWDVTTQQDFGTLPHGAGITSVAFSRDGMLLASGAVDGTVTIWDVTTQQDFGSLEGHRIRVYSVSFSPDERTLASTGGTTVKLWDVATQQNVGILQHGSDIGSVAFSRDGRTLASGAVDGTIKLWDVASGANFAVLGSTAGINSVSFSSDDVTLAVGTEEGTIELWDAAGFMRERLEAVSEIDIPDLNLRAAIAAALGKLPRAPIVQGNMMTLTHLSVVDADISSLTGLEGASKLTELRLPTNNISDISSLTELTNVTVLSLWVNNVSDISPVAELTRLTVLELGNNNISDISPLAGLANLKWLFLTGNNISEISPLAANTGLGRGDTVDMRGNPLSYPSIYTHVPALQERGVEVLFDDRTPQRIRIVSGNDQQGPPGAALEKPFIVKVLDQNGVAFEAVPVTFAVTGGDGTLGATSAATDTNGRAESTLTLGSTPGTNTVRVSVEGHTQAVAIMNIESTSTPMFSLSIPAGIHAIHIPLKVNQINGEDGTIQTVGDVYDALGDAVSFIITIGDDGSWLSYLGNESVGSRADADIGDDTGLIAAMKRRKTLELMGDDLGPAGASKINLLPGYNLVGVPLQPAAGLSMISDLLVDGVGAIAVSNAAGDGFHTITKDNLATDAPLMRGVGYIVVYTGTESTSIPMLGSAWENEGAVSAAPSLSFDRSQTPVLHVEGGVMDEHDMLAQIPTLRVIVTNLSTGASLDTVLGTELSETSYSATFVELSRRAAKAGDVLEIAAHSPNPNVGVRPVPQIVVSEEEVLTNRMVLPDLELHEIPSETELLANYPNPFNPETWIPYRLAKPAEVTLKIYDTNGSLVRTIDAGFKPAAVYESHASAIYWDGLNNYGERVSSGAYFYHLTTGDYFATRRMVLLK